MRAWQAWLAWVACLAPFSASAQESTHSPESFSLVLDIAVTPERVVAVGERGLVAVSLDQGRTWSDVTRPTQATLTCASIVSPQEWWVAGHEGACFISRDQGLSWQKAPIALGDEASVFGFALNGTGPSYLWGAFGLLARRESKTSEWERLESPVGDLHLYQASAYHVGDLLLVGESGAAVQLPANDQPSALPELDFGASWHGSLALRDGSRLVFGLQGRVARRGPTDDKWTELPVLGSELLAAGVELPDGAVVLAGQAGAWWRSRDGGLTFTRETSPISASVACLRVTFDGALLIGSDKGVRRYSLDTLP